MTVSAPHLLLYSWRSLTVLLFALLMFPFYRGEPFVRKLEQIAPLVKPSCILTIASSFPVSDIRAMLLEEVTVTVILSNRSSLLF